MKTEMMRSDIELIFIVSLLSMGAILLRAIRVRSGTSLFIISACLAFLVSGLEIGVSLLDTSILRIESFYILILFVGYSWLGYFHQSHLEGLPGAIQNLKSLSSFKVFGIVFPSLSFALGTSSKKNYAIQKRPQATLQASDLSVFNWFSLWLCPLWPGVPVLALITYLIKKSPVETLLEIWPISLLWLFAGFPLILKIKKIEKLESEKITILIHILLTNIVLGICFVYLRFDQFVFCPLMIGLLSCLLSPKPLAHTKGLLTQTQWTKWMILAAGLSSWLWLINELTGQIGNSNLIDILISHLDQSNRLSLLTLVSPFVLAWISGSIILPIVLIMPFLGTLSSQFLLPSMTLILLGVALSPERLSKIQWNQKAKINVLQIFYYLLLPTIIICLELLFLN